MFKASRAGRVRRQSSRSRLKNRTAWLRRPLALQPLEERILLDASLPPDLVVGRTLSTYTSAGVLNNRLDITYTVYNEQADPISGVLLTDTLETGVSLLGASQPADQNGQNVAWSLGTIKGFDWASVTLAVSLDDPMPLQLDGGARAYGTLNAGLVTDDASPAVLRAGSVDPALLASTPDANTTDPFVQEKAAELDYDPQRIFDYLNSEVGYESYVGSLRGARGTLWSNAGNSLDEASLGVALFRASGIPAQYAHGTLSDPLSQQLILSMFPQGDQAIGLVPADATIADPANDPQLLAETRDHYWVQFDSGTGFQDLDSSGLPGSAIGLTFAPTANTFTEVADAMRHKTQVKLKAETYSQASAAFSLGNGLGTSTVLDQTFNDVDLVGRPLTFGHFVGSQVLPGIVSSITYTYTPYVLTGDEFVDPANLTVIEGTPYQEVLTNFPLGTTVLTGLYLEATLSGPDGPAETFTRTLLDRIGFAERQGIGTSNFSAGFDTPPAISPVDVFTLTALPGEQSENTVPSLEEIAAEGIRDSKAAMELLSSAPGTASGYFRAAIALSRLNAVAFHLGSSAVSDLYSETHKVRAYFDRPRITITSVRLFVDPGSDTGTFSVAIDLRRDFQRVLTAPGQNMLAAATYRVGYGFIEGHLEAELVEGVGSVRAISTHEVFNAAAVQGISILTLTSDQISLLDGLSISPEAKLRITEALDGGKFVMLPAQPVAMGETTTIAWYEIDPLTGENIPVTQDGGHLAVFDILGLTLLGVLVGSFLIAVPGHEGITGAIIELNSKKCLEKPSKQEILDCLNAIEKDLLSRNYSLSFALVSARYGFLIVETYKNLKFSKTKFENGKPVDPPVGRILLDLGPPPEESGREAEAIVQVPSSLATGTVSGTVQAGGIRVSGALAASWTTSGNTTFHAGTLLAQGATVTDAGGNLIGVGAINLSTGLEVVVGAGAAADVTGSGELAFYSGGLSGLDVAGDWIDYTATLSNSPTLQLTTDGLMLDGVNLPADTYIISAPTLTLSGSGRTTSPDFAGSASLSVTDAAVNVGMATGSIAIGGTAVDAVNGITLAGFSGSISVTAGAASDTVELQGAANQAIALSTPQAVNGDQNAPITLAPAVLTSFTGDYEVSAEVPDGWRVVVDDQGQVFVNVAPGVQSGTYPVRVVARSNVDPALVAQAIIDVTVTPTLPGVALTVDYDATTTVPVGDSQSPTSFQATIQNTGPAGDSYQLTFPNPPIGFDVLTSKPVVAAPAGHRAIMGVYLQPNGDTLPAPGTLVSFAVVATSMTNATITDTVVVDFTMPDVHGVSLVSAPQALNTTPLATSPGAPVTVDLQLKNVGNVPETVSLSAMLPAGVDAAGLTSVTLAAGESTTVPLTLTPHGTVPVNSQLANTITATFGPIDAPLTAIVEVDLLIRSEQTIAASQAAAAADEAGNAALGNVLRQLADLFAQLEASPDAPALCQRAEFLLDNLEILLGADLALAALVPQLQPLQDAAATCDEAALLALVPGFFNNLADALEILASEQFTIALSPAQVDLQPGQGKVFSVQLANTGDDPVTLTLSSGPLPGGVTLGFSQTQVTLAAGETASVTASLSQSLIAAKVFRIEVGAAATLARHTATAVVAVRPATADVLSVAVSPIALVAGDSLAVSAQVFNTANVARNVLAHADVLDKFGAVVASLPDLPFSLTPGAGEVSLDLGLADTSNLANGIYTVRVSLRATDGSPLPGRYAEASFLVGMPLDATVSAAPANLPPGTSTVTTKIRVAGRTDLALTPGGKIIVAHDEWVLSDAGFNLAFNGAAQFAQNVANFFTGDQPGSFLVYSDNFSLVGSQLAAVMQDAGHTWTVSTAVPFTLATLQQYDAVFVGAFPADNGVLTDYVNAGGSVYLCAGSGLLGHFGNTAAEAAAWKTFLGNFDLAYESLSNGVSGVIPVESSHPLFAGVGSLYQDLGLDIQSLGGRGMIVEMLGRHELFAIYDGQAVPPSNVVPPPIVQHQLVWTGAASGFWDVAANWTDTTDNTQHVPTANDIVSIDRPGSTITVRSGTRAAASVQVAAGTALAVTGGSLMVWAGMEIDGDLAMSGGSLTARGGLEIAGGLNVSAGILNLGADSESHGNITWAGGTINVGGHSLANFGTMTLGSVSGTPQEILQSRDIQGNFLPHGTLRNLGTIVQEGSGTLNVNDAATVTNEGNYQITGNGVILSSSGPLLAAFDNLGTLTATPAGTATIRTTLNNLGEVRAQSGTLTFVEYVNNAGSIVADGATVMFNHGFPGNVIVDGDWTAMNGGTLAFPTNVTSSQARLAIDGGTSAITGLQNLAINAGTVALSNGADFATSVNFTNRGAISLSPGSTMAITGTFKQETAGTLDVQLGGPPASGQFGKLTATKAATFGGVLHASLTGGYVPAVSDSFTIVTSVGSSGGFSAVVLPAAATDAFQATINANSVVLSDQASTASLTTTTVATSHPGGAVQGQEITFTATVAGGAGTPTGSVRWQIDGVNVGGAVPLSGGAAALAITLPVGQHAIAALYVSNTGLLANSDSLALPLSQEVDPGSIVPTGSVPLYYSMASATGGVSQLSVDYDGASMILAPSTALVRNLDADGLLFLPNGNLLVGGPTIRQIDPVTGTQIGPVINTRGNHLVLDPDGERVWTSRDQGPLLEVPLNPFGTIISHPVAGGVTTLAFDRNGDAWYVSGANFGRIDLATFTTDVVLTGLPTVRRLLQDPYTGDIILAGNDTITQFDPVQMRVVSSCVIGGSRNDIALDGNGHLYAADMNGFLTFIDYSATGLIGDARNFVGSQRVADADLRSFSLVFGVGAAPLSVGVEHFLPAAGYAVDPGSVNAGGVASATNVVWAGQLPSNGSAVTFQFNGNVTDMAPGEVRQISQGTTITAVVYAPNGSVLPVTLHLPPVFVSAQHIVSLSPATQTVARHATTTYIVTLANPLPIPQTYTLSVDGLSGVTADLVTTVVVAAGQALEVPLQLSASPDAAVGAQAFQIDVRTAAGAHDSVEGEVIVSADVVLPTLAVNVQLTPAQAAAGQGTRARYVVRVTNVGNAADAFDLSVIGLPPGIAATLESATVAAPPGSSNFREVSLVLTPQPGTAPGSYPFSVTARSATDPSILAAAEGTLDVLANGVRVTLAPQAGNPGSTFQMTVTNTGQATDTFDLTVAAPAALVSSLGTASVTLGPGESQNVPLDVGLIDFALPGTLDLAAVAVSRGQPAVRGAGMAAVQIAASAGMSAHFEPAAKAVLPPGLATFLLFVDNIGNTEDEYAAAIIGTTGPVEASLIGLDGQPAQQVPLFRLPGLSTGAILVTASLLDFSQGSVTVEVHSLSDETITATATALLLTDTPPEITSNGGGASASIHVSENTAAVTDVEAIDLEPGTQLTFSIVGGADADLFSINEQTGLLTFATPPNFENPADAGGDNVYDVVVQVSDGDLVDTQALAVTVDNANDAPSAGAQSLTTNEDVAKSFVLSGADADAGQALSLLLRTLPAHGVLSSFNPLTGQLTYTPSANYHGPDSFEFQVLDDASIDGTARLSAAATVSILVAPVNDDPTADSQAVSTNEDAAKVITLTAADVDGGQVLTFALVAGPRHGSLSGFNATTGQVTYTPDADYNGPDSFTFTVIDDATAGGPPRVSAAATVSLAVAPLNDLPAAAPQARSTDEDRAMVLVLSGNDGDVGVDQTLAYAIAQPPQHGSLSSFNPATGEVTYTPDDDYFGPDSFSFTVTDDSTAGGPARTSSEAVVSLTVNPINDTPSFSKGTDQVVEKGAATQMVPGWATDLSKGAANESAQTLSFIVTTDRSDLFLIQPAVAADGTLTFRPAANRSGVATVTVRLKDDGGRALGGDDESAPQTFTITVKDILKFDFDGKKADQTQDGYASVKITDSFAAGKSYGWMGSKRKAFEDKKLAGDKLLRDGHTGPKPATFRVQLAAGASWQAVLHFRNPKKAYDFTVRFTDGAGMGTARVQLAKKDLDGLAVQVAGTVGDFGFLDFSFENTKAWIINGIELTVTPAAGTSRSSARAGVGGASVHVSPGAKPRAAAPSAKAILVEPLIGVLAAAQAEAVHHEANGIQAGKAAGGGRSPWVARPAATDRKTAAASHASPEVQRLDAMYAQLGQIGTSTNAARPKRQRPLAR